MVAEGGVNITTLVVLSPLLRVLSYAILLVKGGCPRKNGGSLTGVGWADKGDLADERILSHNQNDPKVAIMSPSTETLDQRHIRGEETMDVLDGHVVQFTWLLGDGWVQEAINNGVDQQGMIHLLSSCQLLR